MFLEGRYKRRNVQWTCITFAAAMDRTPLRKPYGRGFSILAHRSGLTTSLVPADSTKSGPVVDQQPDLIPPEPISSEREYRGPAPDWLQEMDDADNCSSYSEGDFADDFSDEEPTKPPLPLAPPSPPSLMPPSLPPTQPSSPQPPQSSLLTSRRPDVK